MPPIFRTKKDNPRLTIAGVGRAPANGVGGIAVEHAALTLPELQDDDGKPLEGAKLKSAAKKFADSRNLEVAEASEEKIAKLPVLNGGFPDPKLSAREAAESDPFAQFAPTGQAEAVAGVVDPTQDEQEQAAA